MILQRLRLVKKKLQKIDAMEGKDASSLDEGQKALLQVSANRKSIELGQIARGGADGRERNPRCGRGYAVCDFRC